MEAARWVALAAAVVACLLTQANIVQHWRHWQRPALQRHAVRILCMVPVYAVASTLALFVPRSATLVFTVRDVYEAYVLFQFTALLVAYLGGEGAVVALIRQRWQEADEQAREATARAGMDWCSQRYDTLAGAAPAAASAGPVLPVAPDGSAERLLAPFAGPTSTAVPATSSAATPRWERAVDAVLGCRACWPSRGALPYPEHDDLPTANRWRRWWASPHAHFGTIKACILQYAIAMPVLGFTTAVLASLELARRGDFSAEGAFLWLTVAQALSAVVSIVALLHFYWLVRRAIPEFSPGAKFACVKAVIFLSYIQLIALELAAFFGTPVDAGTGRTGRAARKSGGARGPSRRGRAVVLVGLPGAEERRCCGVSFPGAFTARFPGAFTPPFTARLHSLCVAPVLDNCGLTLCCLVFCETQRRPSCRPLQSKSRASSCRWSWRASRWRTFSSLAGPTLSNRRPQRPRALCLRLRPPGRPCRASAFTSPPPPTTMHSCLYRHKQDPW